MDGWDDDVREGSGADEGRGGRAEHAGHAEHAEHGERGQYGPHAEDVFVLPDAWKRNLHPRRGGVPRPVPAVDPDAREKAEALVAGDARWIADMLGVAESDPELVGAARAHQGGSPDPLGAAVLARLATRRAPDPGFFVDAWADAFGLPFAACAAVEFDEVLPSYVQSSTRCELFGVKRIPEPNGGWGRAPRPVVDRARALLAVADAAEYGAAVEALARHRHSPRRRVRVSYLVPAEQDWVTECVSDSATATHPDDGVRALLACALGSAEQLDLMRGGAERLSLGWRGWSAAQIATVAEGVGAALGPVLAAELTGAPYQPEAETTRLLADALAELPGDATFAVLLDRVADKHVRPALLTAARKYPVRALRMLAQAALGQGARATAARRLLVGHVAVHRAAALAALPDLPEEAAALVGLLARQEGRLPEAAADALPALLTSPPWAGERVVVKPVVVAGLTAPGETVLAWRPGEREAWAAAETWTNPWAEQDVEKLAERQRAGRLSEHDALRLFAKGPAELVRPLLAEWDGPTWSHSGMDSFTPIVAAHGPVALPMALTLANRLPAALGPLLMPYVDVRVARLMADWLVRLRAAGRTARTWLLRHGPEAAPLLVPDALAKPGRARTAAEAALRLIALEHGDEAVRAAAAGYGPKALAGLEALLGADPLVAALPVKLPEPGAASGWAELPVLSVLPVLPQIALRAADGQSATALPAAAVPHVLMMLALSRSDSPYPGLAALRELCEPESLAEFAWAVFEEWRFAGMPPADAWAVHALGLLGDDVTVGRLTPVIRAWPGEGAHQRAVDGLDALAAIGTDAALLALYGISQRVRFKALKARAAEKIDEVAAGLGLTGEQLGDRLVPDLGLATDGSAVVDYGARRFTVGLDERLTPYVRDGSGKRLKDLPKPGAQDDAELAPAGRKRYAALKKELRAVAPVQLQRLEAAMVSGRSWTGAEFRRLFVEHPLVGHLARRLVWLAAQPGAGRPEDSAPAGPVGTGPVPTGLGTSVPTPGGPVPAGPGTVGPGTAFRVTDDRPLGSYVDAEGAPVAVAEDAVVTLAHPVHLGRDAVARWSAAFDSLAGAVAQPFPQLARPVSAPTQEEAGRHRLTRFEDLTVPVGKVLGLTRRGWERGIPADAGVERWISRRLGPSCHVVIELDPGIAVGALDQYPEQKLETVWLDTVPGDYFPVAEHRWKLADLDPVLASEILADLNDLTDLPDQAEVTGVTD
ncbi:DUF4132 domain-containing protein [Streptomyces bambusae]|uniref:DUF4132 domain-containing protein n=1 Tax=Streptomyces bambusae TaxID=1550616 RepID=A0ABS6Z9B7_9ACTN|nr:DUF4132 domain-containing protein [Streptomyces bambusae]MBW5484363.1 DUF4132 domain-containing protein [Streptomyces bambusae]